MSKERNLETINEEVTLILGYQQESVDLVYNKFNWILVADFVALAALYTSKQAYGIVLLLITASATFALIGFESKRLKVTERVTDQLDRAEQERCAFLESLIEKKRQAFNVNNDEIARMGEYRQLATGFLIAAIIMQFILLTFFYVPR